MTIARKADMNNVHCFNLHSLDEFIVELFMDLFYFFLPFTM